MSAGRHHRVKPGPVGGGGGVRLTPRPPDRPIRSPRVCDYCARSMVGQEFRGDKCLDCRVRDGEAEVDENGEELVDDLPHRTSTAHGRCWCGQDHP